MSGRKKVMILVPDGVSLRNFAYTSFYALGEEKGYEVLFWNATPFDLKKEGFQEVKIDRPKAHWYTDVLKAARIRIELKLFAKREDDLVYHEYIFPLSFSNWKSAAKSRLIQWYEKKYGSEKGLEKIRKKMIAQERKTPYYERCKRTLEKERPNLLFCASQRAVTSIAPIAAAQDLGIPTACFIFSWDNVPKATTVVTTDWYFVWSDHMKRELLQYQRYIKEEQVKITGTPQFEPHFERERILPRAMFCKKYDLDPADTFVCFSGDDITTSPKDELYLRDIAAAVRALNKTGRRIRLIFRRCPVDFSNRYDAVLAEYKNEIAVIDPLWKQIGEGWNTILPTVEDLTLQVNIIAHSEAVINLASSMVFDFAAHEKPCAYMNYNYLNPDETPEKGVYLYDFVHFRSMPSKDAVLWLSHPDAIATMLEEMLMGVPETVTAAQQWFEIINEHPPQRASERIWNTITTSINI